MSRVPHLPWRSFPQSRTWTPRGLSTRSYPTAAATHKESPSPSARPFAKPLQEGRLPSRPRSIQPSCWAQAGMYTAVLCQAASLISHLISIIAASVCARVCARSSSSSSSSPTYRSCPSLPIAAAPAAALSSRTEHGLPCIAAIWDLSERVARPNRFRKAEPNIAIECGGCHICA